jgi:hypothetical protein
VTPKHGEQAHLIQPSLRGPLCACGHYRVDHWGRCEAVDCDCTQYVEALQHFRALEEHHSREAAKHGRRAAAWYAIGMAFAFASGWFARVFFMLPPFAIEADGVTLKCIEPGAIIAGNALLFIVGITFGSFPLYRTVAKLRRENAALKASNEKAP